MGKTAAHAIINDYFNNRVSPHLRFAGVIQPQRCYTQTPVKLFVPLRFSRVLTPVNPALRINLINDLHQRHDLKRRYCAPITICTRQLRGRAVTVRLVTEAFIAERLTNQKLLPAPLANPTSVRSSDIRYFCDSFCSVSLINRVFCVCF